MRAPSPREWWLLVLAALAIVVLWPPADGRSLGTTFVNWVADPTDALPILPAQLPPGRSDDPEAVEARDAEVRRYDALYGEGGWTRQRLALKVAGEPLRPSLMRQLLIGAAVVVAALTWRIASRPD